MAGYDLRILWKIVNAHYSSYFEPDPRRRVTCAIEGLVGKDYRLKTSHVIFKITLIGMRVCLNYWTSAASWRIGGKDLGVLHRPWCTSSKPVTWPVDDLRSFLQEIGSETVVEPVALPRLGWHQVYRTHENDVFSDSEQLLQKYSILADTLGELSSPAYSQVDLAASVARAQYELFFSRKPQERILAALRPPHLR